MDGFAPRAFDRIYDAADGWVFLAAPSCEEWEALAGALSPYVDLRSDSRFADESERRANDAALSDALAKVLATRGRHEWQRDLTAVDVALVAINDGDPEAQDRADAAALYATLEDEVIPRFFERDADGLPRRWIETMKASIESVVPHFSAQRMVRDYVERFYVPAASRS